MNLEDVATRVSRGEQVAGIEFKQQQAASRPRDEAMPDPEKSTRSAAAKRLGKLRLSTPQETGDPRNFIQTVRKRWVPSKIRRVAQIRTRSRSASAFPRPAPIKGGLDRQYSGRAHREIKQAASGRKCRHCFAGTMRGSH